MTNNLTLGRAMIGTDAMWTKVALVIGASLLVALAAQVSVPMWPVPISMQTLAVLMVAFVLGSRLGAAALALYLAEGAMGLPVFANGMNGAAFFGPTAGFLVGFVGLAWLAGLATDRGISNPILLSLVGIAASLALYIPGLAWPMGVANAMGISVWGADLAFGELLGAFMTPFLIGDAAKAIVAALLVSGGMTWLSKRG